VRLIGLTGGIASGKSLVTGELRRLGAVVLDADEIYHDLLASSDEMRSALKKEFSPEYFDADGRLDRKALSRLVFTDREALVRLNRVTHPFVIDEMWERLDCAMVAGAASGPVFLSVPLLYEAKLDEMVDTVVVVWCPPETQAARLGSRDSVDGADARARLDAQWSIDRKRESADDVIDNSGSVESTLAQVRDLYARMKRECDEPDQ
jgi:dephospho-CoA kinase